MKRKLSTVSQQYVRALKKYLKLDSRASLLSARGLGRQTVVIGLETLDVARIHQGALATLEASSSRDGLNVRLLMLKREAGLNANRLKKEFASTQRLVDISVKTLERFTRECGKPHET